ncbi:MAG: HmuY family protein [Chitinophagaceae bacterium]|nr:HmuY family protein [Chitinophagaceae bacterium]
MDKRNVIFAVLMIVVFASCKKDTTDPKPAEINTKDFLVNGDPSGGNYNFFSFANSAEINEADSSSSKWDFAIRFETFIVNSNASGPGNAGVQIINQPFDAITTAPANSYRYDTTVSQKAIKGADWYTYNPTTRSFSPIAGKTFVFRTATGKYAKLEMISADPTDDLGNLVVPPTRPTKIKYKIRVAYQGDGSLAF